MEFFLSLGKGFTSESSIFYWLLFALELYLLYIVLERTIFLYMKRTKNQKEHSKSICEGINNSSLGENLRRVESMDYDTHPIALVSTAGIQTALLGGEKIQIQENMDVLLLEEQSFVNKNILKLAVIANLSAGIGLVSTLVSISRVMASVSKSMTEDQRQMIISEGVSVAFNSTAYGLMVAVPALIMYVLFKNRATVLTDDLNRGALNVFVALGGQWNPVPAGGGHLTLVKDDYDVVKLIKQKRSLKNKISSL